MTAEEVLANKPWTYFLVNTSLGEILFIFILILVFISFGGTLVYFERVSSNAKNIFHVSIVFPIFIFGMLILWGYHIHLDELWKKDINSYVEELPEQKSEVIHINDMDTDPYNNTVAETTIGINNKPVNIEAKVSIDVDESEESFVTYKYDKHNFNGKIRDVVLHVNDSDME